MVRLGNGALWVWSPLRLREELKAEIDALGPVAHLVSPNKLHHLYLSTWKAAYPAARLWGPRSTIHKRPDLDFETPLTHVAPPVWQGQIDQVWFRGSPIFEELVFFHRRSHMLLIGDLSENFSECFLRQHWSSWKRAVARLWKITEGWGYAPLELRLSWLRRAPARAALERVFAWEPAQVVMAHGKWHRQDGVAYLHRAFRWLEG